MGQIRDRILDEIYDASEKDPKYASKYDELYNIIDGMNNDTDVYNYINANRTTFTRSPAFSQMLLEDMPTFSDALFGQLKTGKVDYDKEFGSDWVNNFEEIPFEQIKYVADKQGVSFNDLTKEMASEATRRRREEIADPDLFGDAPIMDKVGGTLMSLFSRRQQEAIKKGQEPSFRDYAGDIGENTLYAIPWGRGASVIGKVGSKINKALMNKGSQFVLNNMATPVATEAYDALAYSTPYTVNGVDNDVYNDERKDFSGTDIAAGTAINATAPFLVRALGQGMKKMNLPGSTTLSTLNTGETSKEIAHKNMSKFNINDATNPFAKSVNRKKANDFIGLPEDEKTVIANGALADIASKEEPTFGDKLLKYAKAKDGEYVYVDKSGDKFISNSLEGLEELVKKTHDIPESMNYQLHGMGKFISGEKPKLYYDPELMKIYDKSPYVATEEYTPFTQMLKEEGAMNYITNQLGNVNAEHSDPYTRVPLVGGYISRMMKQRAEEADKKALEQQIIEELNKKYSRGK